jgi:AraC-like DNA-binding protein
MVATFQIRPAPVLQSFISCYALRKFNTGSATLVKPMHAIQEFYLTFNLKEKFCAHIDTQGNVHTMRGAIVSMLTEFQGSGFYKGDCEVFCVQFKNNGFFSIFGVPQRMMIDKVCEAEDILGNDFRILTEQLESCKDLLSMASHMNNYLIQVLLKRKHKAYTSTIANVSDIIFRNKGMVLMDDLAAHANMSFRNFERRFSEEVGVGPKLYARITRFFNAVENKMMNPHKKWTDIVYEGGFFDQAHFIKEVKTFSSRTPDELFTFSPPPKEDVKEEGRV